MDLEDKLKQLRRERKGRDRSKKIRDAWEKLDGDGRLTVKEKLERLITLTEKPPTRRGGGPSPDEAAHPRREPVEIHENAYLLGARYGQIPISLGLEIPGAVLAFLSRDSAFEPLDLGSTLFLDLETTGLAGGTGTVPFLIGFGFYREDRFRVAQFFLGDMAEEARLIRDVAGFLSDLEVRSVVTYNGKAFDLPLLETRFALHRTPFPLRDLPHLDFLFSARSLWQHRYDSCRLFDLAREIAHADRDEDIPGAEIPARYFQYLRTGDFGLIEPILYHNQEDILSLLSVVVAGAVLVDRNRSGPEDADAMDLFGVARLFEHAGDRATSAILLERAIEGRLTREASRTALKKLSRHFKRQGDWDKAVSLWRAMSGDDEVHRSRELAMYYEHRAKDLEAAVREAEEGLALAWDRSPAERMDFEKRLARLQAKIVRRQAASEPNPKRPKKGG
jgi:uncharacterized protein YprB with RNaseH-like and TPR domain